jgi:hypothetical protein
MILIARAFDASRLTLSVDSSVRTRIFLRTHNENTRADARVFETARHPRSPSALNGCLDDSAYGMRRAWR